MSDLTYDPSLALDDVDVPVEAVPANTPVNAPAWTFATRLGFRAAFCYCLLYALGCGNATLWQIIPWGGGDFLNMWTAWPFRHGAQWVGQHWLHLTGVGATLHGGGSGDRVLDWVAVGIMIAIALFATLLWTVIDETRGQRALAYPKLFFWMRLILRLALGFAMLGYGLAKFIPLQMAPPSLAVLNEPLGNTSPMTMLWTLIGLNPVYEIICGATEVIAGVLIIFRRTALVGILLSVFLTTNIVLYNFCFDVPVKVYAAHLLLISLVLLAPAAPSLWAYFILHRPTPPVDRWPGPARRYGLRIETLVTLAVFLFTVIPSIQQRYQVYAAQRASSAHPGALTGIWHLDAATLNGQPKPLLTNDGYPLTDIVLEPTGRAMLRGTDNALYRAGAKIDDKKHTLSLGVVASRMTFAIAQPDPAHLVLTPTGKDAKTTSTLMLTRVPLPQHYPLLERGFHFVNEWGLER